MKTLPLLLLAVACSSTPEPDLSGKLAPDVFTCEAYMPQGYRCGVAQAPLCAYRLGISETTAASFDCAYFGSDGGQGLEYARMVFNETPCDPADGGGSCSATSEDWCVYDNPMDGGYQYPAPWNPTPIYPPPWLDGGHNPFDAGWAGIWTGTPCQ